MIVMSYNIHHGVGMDGKLDLERVAGVIAGSGAAVAGLQEVDRHFGPRSDFRDQAKELAGMLGMEVAYGPNLILPPLEAEGEERQYGNAILSKFPIRHAENLALRHSGETGEEARGVLRAELDADGTPLHLFVTHLELDERVRKVQFEELAKMVNGQSGRKIVMGDFNITPESPEIRKLIKDARLQEYELHSPQPTFPADKPEKKIDYILLSEELRNRNQQTIPTSASDHLPLIMEIGV